MPRRHILLTLLLALSAMAQAAMPPYTPTDSVLQAREAFRDRAFGIFIHWGVYSMPGQGEWVLNRDEITLPEYTKLPRGFYPALFDADAWVRAFRDAGAEYVTFTTRHHDGFSMWDSDATDYDIVDATPWKRDVVGELAEACLRHGLGLHLYYSQIDWMRDDALPLGRTGHDASRRLDGDPATYFAFMDAQLTELLTRYGPIGAIWFDGMWDRDELPGGLEPEGWNLAEQYALIHRLQPSCLVGSNHHMAPFPGEDIQIFERDKPGENLAGYSEAAISQLPLETCQTMNDSWGYRLSDNNYKSSDALIRYLVETAGRDANLLLNIGPRPDGTLPEEALERLADMGAWLRRYGPTVKGTRGGPIAPQPWGVTTRRDNTVYLHIFDPEVTTLTLPELEGATAATYYATGEAVPFTHTPEGVQIDIPANDDLDRVIAITL